MTDNRNKKLKLNSVDINSDDDDDDNEEYSTTDDEHSVDLLLDVKKTSPPPLSSKKRKDIPTTTTITVTKRIHNDNVDETDDDEMETEEKNKSLSLLDNNTEDTDDDDDKSVDLLFSVDSNTNKSQRSDDDGDRETKRRKINNDKGDDNDKSAKKKQQSIAAVTSSSVPTSTKNDNVCKKSSKTTTNDKNEKEASSSTSSWSCSACTFINKATSQFCEVCLATKPTTEKETTATTTKNDDDDKENETIMTKMTPILLTQKWASYDTSHICKNTISFQQQQQSGKNHKYHLFSNYAIHDSVPFAIPPYLPQPLFPRNIKFTFAEKAIMACKALLFHDYKTYDQILSCTNSNQAKKLGRSVSNFTEAVWNRYICQITLDVVKAKAMHIQELKTLFRKMKKDTMIVEVTPDDWVWGIGLDEKIHHGKDITVKCPNKWKGCNILGWALMEVLEIVKQQQEEGAAMSFTVGGLKKDEGDDTENEKKGRKTKKNEHAIKKENDDNSISSGGGRLDQKIPDPIIPDFSSIKPASKGRWTVLNDCLLIRKPNNNKPLFASSSSSSSSHSSSTSQSVAAFDLDGTLLTWRCAGNWPSKPEHYELWSSSVLFKLQELYDKEKYKLVIFSNQGGIRSAFQGKIATKVKNLIDWLAMMIDRPLYAVVSTKKAAGYHKPSPEMWSICESQCNSGCPFDIDKSFYVGDSDGSSSGDDNNNNSNSAYQEEGVDKLFAENISSKHGGGKVLQFHTPWTYFGPSDGKRRRDTAKEASLAEYDAPPPLAFEHRASLLGGYLRGPILLVLCGAQGSGKSTFCDRLLLRGGKSSSSSLSSISAVSSSTHDGELNWVHLSQDTIRKGKPGTRQAVEKAAISALADGKSVVIDRMHLDKEQRAHFVKVGEAAGVPVHTILLEPPVAELQRRVRERRDHPGGVQGDSGAKIAAISAQKLARPKYDEGFILITRVTSGSAADAICGAYRLIGFAGGKGKSSGAANISHPLHSLPPLRKSLDLANSSIGTVKLPSVALGTQKVGMRAVGSVVKLAISHGFRCVDTAPTYNNEEELGETLHAKHCFVVVKVPKRAIQPRQVREEVQDSLRKLKRSSADLLLLHWPCDVIEAGTLVSVWNEFLKLRDEGLARSVGVSNFNVGALCSLLQQCTLPNSRPAVNQIERHPLLPQWDVLDFCINCDIRVQAHSPLGQGALLEHQKIKKIAVESGMTTAQVLIAWNIHQGVAVATKCSSESHMQDAMSLFEQKGLRLTPQQMETLDEIGSDLNNSGGGGRFVNPPFMSKKGAVYSWGGCMLPRTS